MLLTALCMLAWQAAAVAAAAGCTLPDAPSLAGCTLPDMPVAGSADEDLQGAGSTKQALR
jgi:hypothetical protein